MAVHQILDQLHVAAALRPDHQQFRVEQPVQTEQGLVAAQFVAHQPVRGLRPLRLQRRLEGDVEQVERRRAGEEAAQQGQPFVLLAQHAVALEQPLRHQGEVGGILLLDALPRLDRRFVFAGGRVDVAQQHIGARALAIGFERLFQMRQSRVGARMGDLDQRELAVIVRDLLVPGLAQVRAELACHAYGLFPILFLLIDVEQCLQRSAAMRRVAQLDEHFLRTVEQSRLEIILSQFEQGGKPLLLAQIAAFEQILVHADRALGFAAAAKQAAQREVQLDRLRIDLDHFDEGLDRLVRLFVEQEIEPLEIGARQRA